MSLLFDAPKARQAELEAARKLAGDALAAFPRTGPMGLTAEAVKATPEGKAVVKRFKADLRAELDARRP